MFCVYIVVKMGVKSGVMRWVLLAIGAILVADSCFVAMVCNMNLGVVLPAVLGLPLLLLGLFWAPAQTLFLTPFGRVIKWVLIGGYALFAASFAVVCGLIAGRITDEPLPGADCVIVLGAAVRGDVPSATLAARLDCAYDYLVQNPSARVIVTGGKGTGEQVTEAQASADYLVKKGLSADRILLENTSTSTQENLLNAREILRTQFPQDARVVIVSSDFHLYRARLVAKSLGIEAETLGNRSIPWLVPNFYLREYVAVMGYALLGRLG